MNPRNIVIVGVGGQGTLLASRILGHLALTNGLDVKLSEVHGMAQRGGSVITHVRYGQKVHSPLVEAGQADVVVAFEALEALRALPFVKKGGAVIASSQRMSPMPVVLGTKAYPEGIDEAIAAAARYTCVDALGIAQKCGNARAANVVLLGVLSRELAFSEAAWMDALAACVPAKALDVNKRAFARGREMGEGAVR